MLYENAPPYALTRAAQGAMRVDRQSRIHRILDWSDVFLVRGISYLPAGFTLRSNA